MKKLKFTWVSLEKAFKPLSRRQHITVLRFLKEAAILDQNFNDAAFLRDLEVKLAGKSGMNGKRTKTKQRK